jgi:Smg protein
MTDIFLYLYETYGDYRDFAVRPRPEALARKLSAVGFEAEEISVALAWLDGLKRTSVTDFTADPRSMRIYTEEEQAKLGQDCLSFIAFFETAEIITPVLRELIIERAMALDNTQVSLAHFKIIVLMVLWSREQELDVLIVEELLYDAELEPMH